MKKALKILLIAVCAALVLVGAAAAGSLWYGKTHFVGKAAAEAAALADAGIPAEAAIFRRTELEMEDGLFVYEVRFHSGGREYNYEIHAPSGTVLSPSAARPASSENTAAPASGTAAASDAPAPSSLSPSAAGLISAEEAEGIALAHAGFTAAEVSRLHTRLDRDDGRQRYEVEFICGGMEYDYEIDPADGTLLKTECERAD